MLFLEKKEKSVSRMFSVGKHAKIVKNKEKFFCLVDQHGFVWAKEKSLLTLLRIATNEYGYIPDTHCRVCNGVIEKEKKDVII